MLPKKLLLSNLIFGFDKTCELWERHNDRLMNPEVLKLRKENVKFYNKYKGKRCFILGNGPSLKDVNLSELSSEYVFTVNNFTLVDNYKAAKTNFHVLSDASFFEMRKEQTYDHDELLENYRAIAEEGVICFMPHDAYDFIKREGIDKILDVKYFSTSPIFDERNRQRVDLSAYISSFHTVVQYAIVIAIYMGFSEIYLLGCDTTNIISLLNCAMGQENKNMHAYSKDDVDKRYKELLGYWSVTDVVYDQYILFSGYEQLNKYCNSHDIKLINCSTKTLISEIERMDLDEVISRSK